MSARSIRAEITLPAEGIVVRSEARWISRANVEAVYGRTWRWLLDLLPELRVAGVPVVGSRKAPMICSAGLDAYLRTQAAAALRSDAGPANDLDEVDALLAQGGTKRAARGIR